MDAPPLKNVHMRFSPDVATIADAAATKAGTPLTALTEAIYKLRGRTLAVDPAIVSEAQRIAKERASRPMKRQR